MPEMEEEARSGGPTRWFPVLVAFLVATVTVAGWQALEEQEGAQVEQAVVLELTELQQELQAGIEPRIEALIRMGRRWERQGGTPRTDWETDAALYIAHESIYQAIEWVDSTFHVQWVVPLQGNEAAQDINLAVEARRRAALEIARDRQVVTISRTIDLVQGGKGFLVYVPLFVDGAFDGFILGVYRVEALLAAVLDANSHANYAFAIYDDDEEIFRRHEGESPWAGRWAREGILTVRNVPLRIRVWPRPAQLEDLKSGLPEGVLATGLLLTVLLGFTVYLAQTASFRKEAIEVVNRDLEKEVAEHKKAKIVLQEREDFLDSIIDNIPNMIFVKDARDLRHVRHNRASEALMGISRDQIIGKTDHDFLAKEEADFFTATDREVLESGQMLDIPEETIHTKLQGTRILHTRKLPIFDAKGRPKYLLGISNDITERKQAEQALRESEQRFHLAVEGSQSGIWDWFDVNAAAEWWSPRFYELLGYENGEIEASLSRFEALLHPDDRARTLECVQAHFAGEAVFDVEYRLQMKSGAYRWFNGRGVVQRDAAGTPLRMVGSITDIHERKQAEDALREREARMRLLYEITSDIDLDFDEQVREALKRTTQLLGMEIGILSRVAGTTYRVEQCYAPGTPLAPGQAFELGQTYCSITLGLDEVLAINQMKDSEHRRHPCYAAFHLESYIGIPMYVDGVLYGTLNFSSTQPKLSPFSAVDREMMYLLRQWIALTLKRKRDTASLRENEARLSSFFNSTAAVISIFDRDLKLLDLNKTGCEKLGLPNKETTLGALLTDLSPQLDDERLSMYRHVLETGEPARILDTVSHPEHGTRYFEIHAFKAGVNLGIIADDVTERERTRAQLAAYATELERSNQDLEEFAYIASHDLQEPLRKIQAFGDRLVSKYADALDARGRDYLSRMQGAARRMQTLVNDLLTLSRVTNNAEPFIDVDLNAVIQEIASDLDMQIERSSGRLDVDDLPTLPADPVQLRQLFQNLISNALKFHREGVPPQVRVYSAVVEDEAVEERKKYAISVEDNGIGFEEKYLDRIFKPFQRLHGRGRYAGTGIGLAICRKVVDHHGGEITATSRLEKGTKFTVILPNQISRSPHESLKTGHHHSNR